MRNVLVMHSFCDSAHSEIGSKLVEISLTVLDSEIIEIEVKRSDKVLKEAQIKYLLVSNNSFSILENDYLIITLHKIYKLIL